MSEYKNVELESVKDQEGETVFLKKYLGDGLYVAIDRNRQLKITAEDGFDITERMYLDAETLKALFEYLTHESVRTLLGLDL